MPELADAELLNCVSVRVYQRPEKNKAWESQKGCGLHLCFFRFGYFFVNFWSYLAHCVIVFQNVD